MQLAAATRSAATARETELSATPPPDSSLTRPWFAGWSMEG